MRFAAALKFQVLAPTLLIGLSCPFSASAVPLLQQLYIQGSALPGASGIPGFTAAETVRQNGQRTISVSANGNFAGAVNTDPSLGNAGFAGTFYHFGSLNGGLYPTALRREAVISGQEQESFSATAVDDAGHITYTATIKNPAAPPTRFGSLWEDGTLAAREGNAIPAGPLAGKFFSTFSGAARTPAGISSWVGGYSSTSLGAVAGSVLFRNTTTFDALLKTGDVIPGQGPIVGESGAVSSNVRWSSSGNHFITYVDLELGITATDELPLLDGVVLTTPSGAVIREGAAIPAADGGLVGETWDIFDSFDVNQSGQYVFSAFSSDAARDSLIIRNGLVLHREADVVDGVTLTGQVQGVALNNAGDLAFVWNKTLFINDQKIAEIGTLVDSNGDGVGDVPISNMSLNNLEITDLPAAGPGHFPVVYVGGSINALTAYMRLVPDFSLYPDFNADGAVDGADLLAWQIGLGVGSTVAQGDADRNAVVDSADLALWRASFGAVAPPAIAATQGVPEPTAAVLAISAALCVVRTRRTLACQQ